MSRDKLGSKQTTVLHNCLFENERYDLEITPHRQTKEYIRSKSQTRKKSQENKNKSLREDFPNDETQSQNQTQIQYRNFKIKKIR